MALRLQAVGNEPIGVPSLSETWHVRLLIRIPPESNGRGNVLSGLALSNSFPAIDGVNGSRAMTRAQGKVSIETLTTSALAAFPNVLLRPHIC